MGGHLKKSFLVLTDPVAWSKINIYSRDACVLSDSSVRVSCCGCGLLTEPLILVRLLTLGLEPTAFLSSFCSLTTTGFSTSMFSCWASVLGRPTLPLTLVRRRGTTFVSGCDLTVLPPFNWARFNAALDLIRVLVRSLLGIGVVVVLPSSSRKRVFSRAFCCPTSTELSSSLTESFSKGFACLHETQARATRPSSAGEEGKRESSAFPSSSMLSRSPAAGKFWNGSFTRLLVGFLTGCRVRVFGILIVGAPLPVLFLSSQSFPGAQRPAGRLCSSLQATEMGWNAWPAGQMLREAEPWTQT